MNNVEKMIQQYLHAWNQNTAEAYGEEFAKVWHKDGIYIDPYFHLNSLDELLKFAIDTLPMAPSRRFDLIGKFDFHHNYVRYQWQSTVDGKTNVDDDYFEFNEDFKITKLISFYKLPADHPANKKD